MSIHETLRQRAQSRKLLAPYLCAGFPSPALTVDTLEALVEGGADVIELGIPFSDPLADGPVIQAASQHALRLGVTLQRVLELAADFQARRTGVPLFLMGYANPILRFGPARFAAAATAAGVAGLLVPDLPPEAQHLIEAPDLPPRVQFAAPNTSEGRLDAILAARPPFLYGVTIYGVTGARTDISDLTLPFLQRLKGRAQMPVLAGFGVSTPDQAARLSAACDGAIVGSALLRHLGEVQDPLAVPDAARTFLRAFRTALDA